MSPGSRAAPPPGHQVVVYPQPSSPGVAPPAHTAGNARAGTAQPASASDVEVTQVVRVTRIPAAGGGSRSRQARKAMEVCPPRGTIPAQRTMSVKVGTLPRVLEGKSHPSESDRVKPPPGDPPHHRFQDQPDLRKQKEPGASRQAATQAKHPPSRTSNVRDGG